MRETRFPGLDPDGETNTLLRAISRLSDDKRQAASRAIANLLRHTDPDVRQEALRKLVVHWQDPNYRTDAREALLHDDDEGVRGTAAFGIACLSNEASREEDTALLLPLVKDQRLGIDLRVSAYEALLLVHGRKDLPPLTSEVNLAREIDWHWMAELEKRT
jgi:HEAT repeat protein